MCSSDLITNGWKIKTNNNLTGDVTMAKKKKAAKKKGKKKAAKKGKKKSSRKKSKR